MLVYQHVTRRELLWMTVGPVAPHLVNGQVRRYPGVAYREYARCLPDFLRRLASESLPAAECQDR